MEHCVREIHCYWPMWLDLITEMESVQKEWRARLASVLYWQFCDNPKYKTEQKMTLKQCWLMNCFLQEKWSSKMFAWREKWHTLIDRYRWGDHWCDSYLAHTVLCWRCVCDCVYLSARVFVEFWAGPPCTLSVSLNVFSWVSLCLSVTTFVHVVERRGLTSVCKVFHASWFTQQFQFTVKNEEFASKLMIIKHD